MSSDDVFALKDNKKLYEVLGISNTASDSEIKKSYHKLAMKYHPDKNPSQEAAEIFKEVAFAYGILSDPDQKRMYDSKTLRSHVEGKAKEYDPMMDANVELSGAQMQDFISRLQNEEALKKKHAAEFEARKQKELDRQAEFDRLHPNFKMPDMDWKQAAERQSSFRTTAELTASLSSNVDKHQEAVKQHEDRENFAPDKSSAAGNKRAMMEEFRRKREASGMKTTEMVEPKVSVLRQAEQDERLKDFVKPSTQSYTKEVKKKVANRSNFDYAEFIRKDYRDGGVVGDAVLADALADYNPH